MLNYVYVKIKGVNPDGGRSRIIRRRVLKSADYEHYVANHYGDEIAGPYVITELPPDPPTNEQIQDAADYGISIPDGATKDDVSELLFKGTGDRVDPDPDLLKFALGRDILLSDCIGKKELYYLIFRDLPLVDKAAFFCFCVYRYLSGDRHANLDTSTHHQVFYEFANAIIGNDKFVKSMNTYAGQELRFFGTLQIKRADGEIVDIPGGSTRTYAYKETREFLDKRFNLQKGNRRIIDETQKEDSKKGCLSVFLMFFTISGFVLLLLF